MKGKASRAKHTTSTLSTWAEVGVTNLVLEKQFYPVHHTKGKACAGKQTWLGTHASNYNTSHLYKGIYYIPVTFTSFHSLCTWGAVALMLLL